MSISKDEVAHIGRLARLDLSPEEMVSLTHDLGEILGYVEKIALLDSDVEAMDPIVITPTPMRDDIVQPSLPAADALRPSADHDAEFFRVPPVIEREEA